MKAARIFFNGHARSLANVAVRLFGLSDVSR